MNKSPHPISRVCPGCGSRDFKKVDPDWQPAMLNDRICQKCSTRYSPPVPAWAPWVLILLGAFCLAVGALYLYQFAITGRNAVTLSPEYSGVLILGGLVGIFVGSRMILKK